MIQNRAESLNEAIDEYQELLGHMSRFPRRRDGLDAQNNGPKGSIRARLTWLHFPFALGHHRRYAI